MTDPADCWSGFNTGLVSLGATLLLLSVQVMTVSSDCNRLQKCLVITPRLPSDVTQGRASSRNVQFELRSGEIADGDVRVFLKMFGRF